MIRFVFLTSIIVLSSYSLRAENKVIWDCELLDSILESETSYGVLKDWMAEMEERQLDETEYEHASGGPGLYILVSSKSFNWEALQVEPFAAEIRILGRNPRKPAGYFIKLHRMFGFAMIYGDKESVWINTDFICSERGRIYGYNMPESVMKGPRR